LTKKAAFYTLGCKVNFCDTESLQALFAQAGYDISSFNDDADIYVINTCTVTHQSDHKSRKAIRQTRRRAPHAVIVVTGCYAQRYPEELQKMKEINLVVGTTERQNLPEIAGKLLFDDRQELVKRYNTEENSFDALPLPATGKRTRGFLKIQDGCNEGCTYCIVPSVRGPIRSLSPPEVINRAENLISSGCREIVLTGIHLGLYGQDLLNCSLASLLGELNTLPGLIRLRLSSLEPTDITSELVEQVTSANTICPHLHIPLQSGDGEILKKMKRLYAPVEYLYLAKWLKQQIPDLSLSSDVIVGFPGETAKHHARSMALVRDIGFSSLHVFKYSPRPGTAASTFPGQVNGEVKNERSKEMIALGREMSEQYRKGFIGSIQPLLVEKVDEYSYVEGFTPHYLRVRAAIRDKGDRYRGAEIKVKLRSIRHELMMAIPLDES